MSRDSQFKWGIIAATIAASVILLPVRGLELDAGSLLFPACVGVLLGVVGLYYRRRGEPVFVLCVNALLQLVVFSWSFMILMYVLTTLSLPLIDQELVRLDELMGCHLPGIVSWAKRHSSVQHLLEMAYNTLLPQTAVVVGVLGLAGDRRALEEFMRRFMIGASLTAVIFALLPAAGPFEVYPIRPSSTQQNYLEQFKALRSGEMRVIPPPPPKKPEGLITFPSFHTTWAILMAMAFWPSRSRSRPPRYRRWLFLPSAILNGAVVISTMTTGWHYVSDVVAGVAVSLIAMLASWVIGRWADASGPQAGGELGPRAVAR